MVRPFQLKEVKQILPFLFSHFFPVHGILHERENRFSFLSNTHAEATIKTAGQQTSLKKWKLWDERKYLVKSKAKTEDACISH